MINHPFIRIVRYLLFPLSIVYAAVLQLRNWFFDCGCFESTSFEIPVIAVGNLSIGGTGKTPQIEYLIRHLHTSYKIAVLSRGYKRQSKGFILANSESTVAELGDEPFQYHKKFSNVYVAVDADRTHGIKELLSVCPDITLILLDDAFQHRKVKASFYILLTAFDNLYTSDCVLPVGNLRESKRGAYRADTIVITKCPEEISISKKEALYKQIKPLDHQQLFYTSIVYDTYIYSSSDKIALADLKEYKVLLITGIADPNPLLTFLKTQAIDYQHLQYPDHYDFKRRDLQKIQATFSDIVSSNKIMLTTEKDGVRLQDRLETLYTLGIQTSFHEGSDKIFRTLLQSKVKK